MDHIIVYDTETAGLSLEEGLVEHAWLEIDDDLNVIDEVRSLICPPGVINPGASGVHGLTLDDVKDAPTVEEFWSERGYPFRDKKVLMVAHNAVFDAKYIAPYVGELHTLCTLKLARIAFPLDAEGQAEGYTPPPNHKLPTLLFYLGMKKRETHNAMGDAYICLQLLGEIGEKLQLNLEGLFELSDRRIEMTKDTKIEFGKNRGKRLRELDSPYVRWLLTKCENLDPELRAALEKL